MEPVDPYVEEIEAGASWLGEWLRLVVNAEWPGASISYEGAAANGSRAWRIFAVGGEHWFAVTEPSLLQPMVREIPLLLERLEIGRAMALAEPAGLLVSTGGRLFAWDRARDRGLRLLDLDG